MLEHGYGWTVYGAFANAFFVTVSMPAKARRCISTSRSADSHSSFSLSSAPRASVWTLRRSSYGSCIVRSLSRPAPRVDIPRPRHCRRRRVVDLDPILAQALTSPCPALSAHLPRPVQHHSHGLLDTELKAVEHEIGGPFFAGVIDNRLPRRQHEAGDVGCPRCGAVDIWLPAVIARHDKGRTAHEQLRDYFGTFRSERRDLVPFRSEL